MNAINMRPGLDLARRPHLLLQALIAWQLSAWVLLPAMTYAMLPLDTLEASAWGAQWQWGYYKHPPLGAWLAQASVQLGGGHLQGLYVLAQLVLAACLVYVWMTARLFLDPVRAAMATALLAGSYFHSVLIPNFNMNTLQLPLWAGLCYHLLRILAGARRHWWAFALLAALSLLAKYSSLLILAGCGALILGTVEGRRSLRHPEPWLAALFGLLLLAPHLHWLAENDWLPIRYLASFQEQASPSASAHLLEPLRFAVGSLLSLLGSLLLFLLVLDRKQPWPSPDRRSLFLLLLFLAPLLLTMAYGAISGSRLKATWAFPFYSLAGIVLFRFLPSRGDGIGLARFSLGLAMMCMLVLGLHLTYKTGSDRSKTAFDGEALALSVNQVWRDQYQTPLRIVIADHVLAAIVAGYAPDRPAMLIDGDFAKSPWLSEPDLRSGAIVLCPDTAVCLAPYAAASESVVTLESGGRRFSLRLIAPVTSDQAEPANPRSSMASNSTAGTAGE